MLLAKPTSEEEQIQRGTDHWVPAASRGVIPIKELCRNGGFSDATAAGRGYVC
jgi:hypothetical protein